MGGVVNIRVRAARQSDDEQLVMVHGPLALREASYLGGEPRDSAMLGMTLVLLTFAGWYQHLYTCFNASDWGFLITGAVMSPIGIINGWGIWLGWW